VDAVVASPAAGPGADLTGGTPSSGAPDAANGAAANGAATAGAPPAGSAGTAATDAALASQATVASAKKGAAMWDFSGAKRAVPDSGVGWYYTWSTSPVASTGSSKAQFVPMIHSEKSVTPTALARAKGNGKVLLGFNEPDVSGQADMSVDRALSLWPKLQATGMRLISPVVASHADIPGSWLDRFMSGAKKRNLRVDAIALHWYGGDFDTQTSLRRLKNYVTAVHDRYGKPIWVTEFALKQFHPTVYATTGQQSAFLTAATAMLESLSFVERYAWYAFPTLRTGGTGTGLYRTDGTPTAMGSAYRVAGKR
jgi:hypothetical protein